MIVLRTHLVKDIGIDRLRISDSSGLHTVKGAAAQAGADRAAPTGVGRVAQGGARIAHLIEGVVAPVGAGIAARVVAGEMGGLALVLFT